MGGEDHAFRVGTAGGQSTTKIAASPAQGSGQTKDGSGEEVIHLRALVDAPERRGSASGCHVRRAVQRCPAPVMVCQAGR